MKKKTVMLLINQLHGGGAQKVIANLSIFLSQSYKVVLVIYNDIEKIGFDYGGELITLKLPYAQDTHTNSFLKRLLRSRALISKLKKIKRQKQVDVSISFMEASNFANVLSRTGEKIILSVRSYLSHEFMDHARLKVFSRFIRLLYNRADHVVVPAQLVKNDLIDNFGVRSEKLSIVYNFTDKEIVERLKLEEIPHHHESIFRSPVLINVGRVTTSKAQWLLPSVLKV